MLSFLHKRGVFVCSEMFLLRGVNYLINFLINLSIKYFLTCLLTTYLLSFLFLS